MIRAAMVVTALALSGCCIPVDGDGDFSSIHATDDDRVDAVPGSEPDEEHEPDEKDREDYEGYEREFEEWKAKRERD